MNSTIVYTRIRATAVAVWFGKGIYEGREVAARYAALREAACERMVSIGALSPTTQESCVSDNEAYTHLWTGHSSDERA